MVRNKMLREVWRWCGDALDFNRTTPLRFRWYGGLSLKRRQNDTRRNLIPMNHVTNKDAGRTAAEATAAAEAMAKAENLTPREVEHLALGLENNPLLTPAEALEHLRLAGM